MPVEPPPVERDARALAAFLDRRRYLALLVLTLAYAFGAVSHARGKPLWYDEIITVIAASAPNSAAVWKVAQKTDASPPLPHLLTHFAMYWFGAGEVTLRLPAIVGYWIYCLCLFCFVRRRLGIYYGLAAFLLPCITEAYRYAYEARAYGPELAFCGLMLLSWQIAGGSGGLKRLTACALLSLSLMGAILCHYYAIALYIPLAIGELVRSRGERRIAWSIWVAMALGIAPLVWRVATVRAVVGSFSRNTWAPASIDQIFGFWEVTLPHTLSFLVLALALIALWRQPSGPAAGDKPANLPRHELAAGALFLAIPVFVVVAGVLVTHMFTERYALLGLTAIPLLVPAATSRLAAGHALPGLALLGLTALPFAIIAIEDRPRIDPFAQETILAKALEHGPVVVSDGHMFLQMWYYAPPRLKSNVLYLLDAPAAAKFMIADALDIGISGLRPWCSVDAIDYRDFAMPGREFRVYQNIMKPGWVLPRVLDDGGSARIEQAANFRQLLSVRLPDQLPPPR